MLRAGSAGRLTLIHYAFGIPRPGADGQVGCFIEDTNAAYGRAYSAAESVSGAADGPNQALRGHFNQLRQLKAMFPRLRVSVSLGGWTGSGWFSVAARTREAREAFVSSCLDLFIQGNLPEVDGAGGKGAAAGVFDGIDIDWEYPVGGGLPENQVDPRDKENFTLLLEEFRRQYAAAGRNDLLLTAAVPAAYALADQYGMTSAHPLLDYVMVMTYDMRGGWSPVAGHHTNMYAADLDPDPRSVRLSAARALRHYQTAGGVPAGKLLVGAAFYGRGWRGVSPEEHGLYRPAAGEVRGLNYRDLARLKGEGFSHHWDDSAAAPWLYHPGKGIFWSYDDPRSAALKARYAREAGLAGAFFWEISGDDDQGSLVKAIYTGSVEEE
jgi:chitinase